MLFQFLVIQILLRYTSTNHTLIFKNWFYCLFYLRKTCITIYQKTNEKQKIQSIPIACLNCVKDGSKGGELVRGKETSGFMLSDFRDHTA